jgi:hypothetical protein
LAQKLFLHQGKPPPGEAFATGCFPFFCFAARSLGRQVSCDLLRQLSRHEIACGRRFAIVEPTGMKLIRKGGATFASRRPPWCRGQPPRESGAPRCSLSVTATGSTDRPRQAQTELTRFGNQRYRRPPFRDTTVVPTVADTQQLRLESSENPCPVVYLTA